MRGSSFYSRGFAPIVSLVMVAVLALAVPLTVNLAQKAQIIRSYASDASKAGDAAWAQAKLAGKSDDEARKAAENSYNRTAQEKPPSEKESRQDAQVDQAKQQAIQQAGGDSSKVNPNTVKKIEQAYGVAPSNTSPTTTLTTTGQVCNSAGQSCEQAYPDACTTSGGQPGVRNCQKRGVCSGIGGGALCGGATIQWGCSECVPKGQNPAAAPALPPAPSAAVVSAEQKRIINQQIFIINSCRGDAFCVAEKSLQAAAGNNVVLDPNSSDTSVPCPNGICPIEVLPPGNQCTTGQTKCSGGLEYSCEDDGRWGGGHRCSAGLYCTGTSCPKVAQLIADCGGEISCVNGQQVVCKNGQNWAEKCPDGQECFPGKGCEKIAYYNEQLPEKLTVGCSVGKTSCLNSQAEIYCADGKINTTRPCPGGQTCRGDGCKPISETNQPVGASAGAPVPSKPAESLITPPSPTIPKFPASDILTRGYSVVLQGNGEITTEQNVVPLLSSTFTNGTSYERAVIRSPSGNQTEVQRGQTANVSAGDKIITPQKTYVVQQNEKPKVTSEKLPIPKVSEADQGSLVGNIVAKLSEAVFGAIFGQFTNK